MAGPRSGAVHRRRHRHPAPWWWYSIFNDSFGALPLRGDPPARSACRPPRPRTCWAPTTSARPAEPPHPRRASVVDGGAGRNRTHRHGGDADRWHQRLHRRSAGPGDAATSSTSGWRSSRAASSGSRSCRVAGRGRLQIIIVLRVSGGIAASRRGARCRAGGQGERLLPGGSGHRQLAPTLVAAAT